MAYELQLPEGAVFKGELDFVPASVEIDEDKLTEAAVEFIDQLADEWLGQNPKEADNKIPVVINGREYIGEIVNIGFSGEFVIAMGTNMNGLFGEKPATYYYVKTRAAVTRRDRTVPIQGVVIHRGDWIATEPPHLSSVDAIRAFEYIKEV